MGNPRPRPLRLAEKLLQIRTGLGLSQTQMLDRLGLGESMHYGRISEYEQDKREQPSTSGRPRKTPSAYKSSGK